MGSGYRVERELGGGGMSRVSLATEVALDRADSSDEASLPKGSARL